MINHIVDYKYRYIALFIIIILVLFWYLTKDEVVTLDTHAYGKFKCFSNDPVICGSIRMYGQWEQHISDILSQYYIPNTNFLDIGSNYGCHSLAIAKKIKNASGTGKVYSFEIQPKIYNLFLDNIKNNNFSDIINPNLIGLSNKNEVIHINVPDNYKQFQNYGSLGIKEMSSQTSGKTINTKLVKLDDLSINNISLIKLDVEGHELEVLEGSLNTLLYNKPIILIEIWEKHKDKYFDWINTYLPYYKIKHVSNDDYILFPTK